MSLFLKKKKGFNIGNPLGTGGEQKWISLDGKYPKEYRKIPQNPSRKHISLKTF